MSIRSFLLLATFVACLGWGVKAQAVTVQSETDILPTGEPYLWVEAESASELINSDTTGYRIVTKEDPIFTPTMTTADPPVPIVKGGLPVLPADTNASGGALMDQIGGPLSDSATWEMQFAIPGRYYLYMHYTFYNSDTNTNYGNEDSVYVPPAFNRGATDAENGWIGFEGEDQFGDPKVGNSVRDGWMPLFKGIVSEGVEEVHNDTNEDYWDGQFHWAYMGIAVDMDENNAFVGDFGQAIYYDVSEEQVGQTLTFNVATRENFSVFDGFAFVQSNELLVFNSQVDMDGWFLSQGATPLRGDFTGNGSLDAGDINALTQASAAGTNDVAYDLNGDGLVNVDDVKEWIRADDIFYSWVGDANLDKVFDSNDLIDVLAAATYEVDVDATWTTGDFNGNGRFASGDLIDALADGGYELGVRTDVASVPEPAGFALALIGLAAFAQLRRNRR